jgi:HAD superfamily hydrolase (TIGR01549 family)
MTSVKPIIVFDFDGVICDSIEVILDSMNQLAPWLRYKKITRKQSDVLKDLSTHEILKEINLSYWKVPLVSFYVKTKMKKQLEKLRIADGMPTLIKTLKIEGYRLQIVSSNSVSNVKKFLHTHHLFSCFEEIIGGVSFFSKSQLLSNLQQRFSQAVVYIGDEERDVVAAKNAGVVSIAACWGFHSKKRLEKLNPHALLQNPQELIPWIQKYYNCL